MAKNFPNNVPDALTLLQIFGSEPIEARPEDGYWCYEVTDTNQITLRLSWNIIEKSLQVTLSVSGRLLTRVSQEGEFSLTSIDINNGWGLKAVFDDKDRTTNIFIQVSPNIQVTWGTLLDYQ